MTEEQERKDRFVCHELRYLLQAIDRDIINTEYQVIGGEEFVQIDWLLHGSGHDYHKKILVTADSLKALTIDVIRHI